jgi:hypothetical protein
MNKKFINFLTDLIALFFILLPITLLGFTVYALIHFSMKYW